MSDTYNLKIIDFGDAKYVNENDDEEAADSGNNLKFSRRGTFVGTMNYQSPEVINDEDQGHPVDIWAAGNILFKMFTGYVPFKGSNHAVYKDIKERNIQWPLEHVLE